MRYVAKNWTLIGKNLADLRRARGWALNSNEIRGKKLDSNKEKPGRSAQGSRVGFI